MNQKELLVLKKQWPKPKLAAPLLRARLSKQGEDVLGPRPYMTIVGWSRTNEAARVIMDGGSQSTVCTYAAIFLELIEYQFTWYFAAQFNRLTDIAQYAERARDAGLTVNSRWLTQAAGLGYSGGSEGAGAMFAARDLEDIKTADGLLFFAEDPVIGIPRGGRHVEFGVALALGKKIEVCGPKENVFHLLPNITHYKTFEGWLEAKCNS